MTNLNAERSRYRRSKRKLHSGSNTLHTTQSVGVLNPSARINQKPTVFIAGATSIFGLSSIKEVFNSLGFNTSFVDAPFMEPFLSDEETEKIEFLKEINISDSDFVLPLSEYWISYCLNNLDKNIARISKKALLASRSKILLNETLQAENIDVPQIFATKEEAYKALQSSKSLIIKPEGLHSGYGVEILKDPDMELLEKYFLQASTLKNKVMRIMQIENKGALFSEYVEGTEYSADCFWFCGKMSLVRLCRKNIVNIKNKPCTACIQLVEPDEPAIYALQNWMNALFEKTDISFAQFDFIIEEKTKRILPIDFATRIGGGMTELLKELPFNTYSEAVKNAKENETNRFSAKSFLSIFDDEPDNSLYTQLNYLSTKSGYIINDNYPLYGKNQSRKIIYKHKGDYAISNPSSVQSRLAIVLAKLKQSEITDELIDSLLLGEPFIGEK